MCLDIILKLEIRIRTKCPRSGSRKQTLVNAERYITEEFKTFESEILQAGDRILGSGTAAFCS